MRPPAAVPAIPSPVFARSENAWERLSVRYDAGSLPVLVMDADAVASTTFAGVLGSCGHAVEATTGVAEAERRLLGGGRGPRVLIIDIGMEGAAGLIAALRARPVRDYVYVIALTRIYARAEADRAFAAGADDLLVKPFLIDVLLYRIQVAARIIALEDGMAARNQVLEAADRRYREDLAAAVRVQRSLLPPQDFAMPGLAIAWSYVPGGHLAGDLLNFVPLDEVRVAFWVLDVSGHGLPSALLAVQVNRFLLPVAGQDSLTVTEDGPVPPVEVVEALNRRFPMDLRTQLYFTICYGVLDLGTGEVDLVCAAHPGPLVVHGDGSWHQVLTSGVAVGWLPHGRARFSCHHLQLEPGDRMYVCSDGPIEAADADLELFGGDRIARVLAAHRDEPLMAGLAAVDRDIEAWSAQGDPDSRDDRSILAVEYRPVSRRSGAGSAPSKAWYASPAGRSP